MRSRHAHRSRQITTDLKARGDLQLTYGGTGNTAVILNAHGAQTATFALKTPAPIPARFTA